MKSRAGDFILQFPLVTSDTIEQDTVELMRNQLELERAFEFDFVLTNSPLQTFDAKDPTSFMSDLHNNVNLSESTKEGIKRSNDYLLETPEEKFNMNSLNDMTITREEMKELLNESGKQNYNDEYDGKYYSIDFDMDALQKSKMDRSKTFDVTIKTKDVEGDNSKEYTFKRLNQQSNDRNIEKVLDGILSSEEGDRLPGNVVLRNDFIEAISAEEK